MTILSYLATSTTTFTCAAARVCEGRRGERGLPNRKPTAQQRSPKSSRLPLLSLCNSRGEDLCVSVDQSDYTAMLKEGTRVRSSQQRKRGRWGQVDTAVGTARGADQETRDSENQAEGNHTDGGGIPRHSWPMEGRIYEACRRHGFSVTFVHQNRHQ